MKRFSCACGHPVFFESSQCVHCGAELGFDPATLEMLALQTGPDGSLTARHSSGPAGTFRHCGNRLDHGVCNWLLAADDTRRLCRACELNHTIPNVQKPENLERWRKLEHAKKRLCYSLLSLGLPMVSRWQDEQDGLWFDFLEDQRSDVEVAEGFVTTGHLTGTITINILEADDVARESTRTAMDEPYRTLLGHFRHEIAHYFWPKLFSDTQRLEAFRAMFGDERVEYGTAMEGYYANANTAGWEQNFISAYAQSHPLEDWAETWAHYLHMVDTLETACSYGLTAAAADDFEDRLQQWLQFTLALNELNRSMGLPDAYPFVVSKPVRDKLHFIYRMIADLASRAPAPATRETPR